MVGMDMSGGMESAIDYSEFEYQQFQIELEGAGDSSNPKVNVDGYYQFDPLQNIGGLNNNEIAELLYQRFTVHVEAEGGQPSDQTRASSGEIRGTFGANLNDGDLLLTATENVDAQEATSSAGQGASFDFKGVTRSDNRIFSLLQSTYSTPFEDGATGTGGSGGQQVVNFERSWRGLTGRGPVLDSTDDLTMNLRLIVNDTVINQTASIRGHLVFDTAEVDDAGREFSVPK